jgi:branched-chain amino acid transport system substrate-binding protein
MDLSAAAAKSESGAGSTPSKGMKKQTKIAAVVIAVILIVAIGAYIYSHYSQTKATNTLLVGVVAPITGGYGAAGTPWLDGIKVWANVTNAQGGVTIAGTTYKISLDIFDDGSNPSTAVTQVRTAITVDHVDMLLSGFLTPDTDAIASVIQQYQYPIVADATDDQEFHVGNPYLFTILPALSVGEAPCAAMLNGLKIANANVSIINADEVGMMPAIIAQFNDALPVHYNIVYNQTYDPSSLTVSAADNLILAANAAKPQILIISDDYASNNVILFQQMKALNVRPNVIFSEDMWDFPYFYSQLGSDMNGIIGEDNWAYNMTTPDASGGYANATFWASQMNKDYPQFTLSQLGYQAIMAAQVEIAGMQKAGAMNGLSVAKAISQLDIATVDGIWHANQYGNDNGHSLIWVQIQNGEPEIISPSEYATTTVNYPLSSSWP